MTPQEKKERLDRIRRTSIEYDTEASELREDIEFLLDIVPAGIDVQIDSAEEQRVVDRQRREQAAKIIGSPVSLEQAIDFAINWCVTAMQETCNADYWKERAQAAERLLGMKVEKTTDGSTHIKAPPGGLVLEGVTIKGKDAT